MQVLAEGQGKDGLACAEGQRWLRKQQNLAGGEAATTTLPRGCPLGESRETYKAVGESWDEEHLVPQCPPSRSAYREFGSHHVSCNLQFSGLLEPLCQSQHNSLSLQQPSQVWGPCSGPNAVHQSELHVDGPPKCSLFGAQRAQGQAGL